MLHIYTLQGCRNTMLDFSELVPFHYGQVTFMEIDYEIISMVNLLPFPDSFKKGCCQLQAKVCAQITG